MEEDEFLNFLIDMKVNYEKSQSVTAERRYLYAGEPTPINVATTGKGKNANSTTETAAAVVVSKPPGGKAPVEYFPPASGKVTIKITGE